MPWLGRKTAGRLASQLGRTCSVQLFVEQNPVASEAEDNGKQPEDTRGLTEVILGKSVLEYESVKKFLTYPLPWRVTAAAVAFGIGWGRSGFHADMGFAWRYGWIVAPAVTAAYFGWLTRGGRWAVIGPAALFAVTLVTAPINCISGFREGEFSILPIETWWEADVRAGLTAEQVLEKYDPACGGPFKERVLAAMRLMRARHYSYYESLGEDPP